MFNVDSSPLPAPRQQEAINKVIVQESPMCTREVLPSQDASLPQIESTKPLAFVNQQLQVVIRDEALIKKLLAPVAFFFLASKGSGTQPRCTATYFSV